MRGIGGAMALGGVAAALGLGAASAPACGCGIALDARAVSERAYLGFAGGREELVVSLGLSARSHAAVVLPVPATPKVDIAPNGRALFTYLRSATKPQTVIVHRPGPPPVGGGAPGGSQPVVVGTKNVGGYTITRLRGGTSATLQAWLDAHGYSLPSGAKPILARYISQGWSFVAVRLNHRAKGLLAPVRLRFKATAPVYPLRLDRLATDDVDLDLWTVTEHRMTAPHLTLDYAGPVTALSPAVPAALQHYLGAAGWVTHFEATPLGSAATRSDVLPVPAATDSAFRRTVQQIVYDG